MHTGERRLRAMINPFSTAFAEWWCRSSARFVMTGYGMPGLRLRRRNPDSTIFVIHAAPATSEECSSQTDINRPRTHTIDPATCEKTIADLLADSSHREACPVPERGGNRRH